MQCIPLTVDAPYVPQDESRGLLPASGWVVSDASKKPHRTKERTDDRFFMAAIGDQEAAPSTQEDLDQNDLEEEIFSRRAYSRVGLGKFFHF